MDDTSLPSARERHSSAVPAIDDGDDSEWEYEYSSTETEASTHLITLDLSLPEFLRRREDYVVHSTRGGFRSWMNPLLAGDDMPMDRPEVSNSAAAGPSSATARPRGRQNGDAAADDDSEAEDVENAGRHPAKPTSAAENGGDGADGNKADDGGDDDGAEPAKIQILELHSAQPILSYRGTVFAGAWTESVGTEMLFADAKSGKTMTAAATAALPLPLPHVRRLPQDVDLLGASTARIACTPVELRRRRQRTDEAAAATGPAALLSGSRAPRRRQFAIPVAGGATEQRQRQAAFLERLMAAKHQRGERDVVTVQAVETRQDAVQDDVEEERLRRKKAAQFERYRLRASRRRREEGAGGVAGGTAEGTAAVAADKETGTTTASAATSTAVPEARTRAPARSRKTPRSSIARVTGDVEGHDHDDGSASAE